MSISLSAIKNGVLSKLRKTKSNQYSTLSWLQEKILKHQDDVSIKQIKIGEIEIEYKRPYELLHAYKELFEDEIYRFPCSHERPYIVDCGSNIGLSVLYFKRLYPKAEILAFEPDNENFRLLQKNIAANNLTGIECRQSAVWVHNNTINFSSDGTQGSQIATADKQNSITVKAERLADIIQDKKVDFLKIDIEGAEVDVIKDCQPFLSKVENIFVEYHGKANESEKLSQLMNVLKENHKIYIKMAADNIEHPFTEKETGTSFDVQLNIFCYQ